MSTIDQKGQNGNPTNEPSADATGGDAGADASSADATRGDAPSAAAPSGDAPSGDAPSADITERTEEAGAVTFKDASTSNGWEDPTPRSGEAARAQVEQHTPQTLRGLTALALLRAVIEEHGLKVKLEGALLTLDGAIRRAAREDAAGGNDEPPVSAQRPAEGGGDDEPTTARTLPPNLSTLVLRLNDGAMLVSLEDAGDRDLTGREVIRCMVLTGEESKHALEVADEALSDAAATIVGALPMSAA
jgi:hypothetical protein